MSSKMQFQVFYGEYNVMYGPNGVDLSAFKRTSSGIDKPLERSFGSICKWLQRGFHVDPLTHVITVQSLVNWEVESELWELMMIHSTDDWQKYMQAALERVGGLWPFLFKSGRRHKMKSNIVQIKELRVFEERPIMLSKMSQKRQRTKTWDHRALLMRERGYIALWTRWRQKTKPQ